MRALPPALALALAATLAGGAAIGAPGRLVLRSAAIELPAEDEALPDGPHADLVRQSCLSCHSANMILSQPRLSADQWQGTVTKMREAYKAPIAAADTAGIMTYLTALSAGTPAAAR